MKLKKAKYSLSNVEDLPTFIIIDDEQLLLLIGRNGKRKLQPYGRIMMLS